MVPSAFNVRVPLRSGDVFLMNTLTDAQAVVSRDVTDLLDGPREDGHGLWPDAESREAATALTEHGFLVADRESEHAALRGHFSGFREDTSEIHVTLLTTMQCNFACEYCYQGEHGTAGAPAERMSLATARRVAGWIGREVERVRPGRLVLTFFGGEPLLNPDAMFEIAERCHGTAARAGIDLVFSLITNGLLLTPEIVTRLLPLGLCGVKVTLDGDRETHDRVRPLRGGQGTFDRIIENMRRVAPLVPISVGGNFDASTAARYPPLLDFLREQDFAGRIVQVSFKPVITRPARPSLKGAIPLVAVEALGTPRTGGCQSAAGAGSGSICDSCHFADDQMAFLQDETTRRGFKTIDGVHMGPCDLYRAHSHTIGPDGSLFACPGFTGDNARPVGHVDREPDARESATAAQVSSLAPWRACGDCAFIPVCGGGCAVAAHTELGDLSAPSCHKRVFEAALQSLAEETAHSTQRSS